MTEHGKAFLYIGFRSIVFFIDASFLYFFYVFLSSFYFLMNK